MKEQCDYTVAWLQQPVIGEANEDCAVQARSFEIIYEPFYSIDYAIEAGYQVVEIGACVFLDLAWLVCSNWRLCWELVRSFVKLLLHDLYDI